MKRKPKATQNVEIPTCIYTTFRDIVKSKGQTVRFVTAHLVSKYIEFEESKK